MKRQRIPQAFFRVLMVGAALFFGNLQKDERKGLCSGETVGNV